MKPIEFMDALSDVNNVYVCEMLDETQAPAVSGETGGAVTGIIVQSGNMQSVSGSGGKQASEPTGIFGGKLRYLALIASAAACFAIFTGVMHLHRGEQENSFAANSMISEIDEIENVTGTTVSTEEAVIFTTVTTVETADDVTAVTVITQTDPKPEQTEASTETAQVTDTTTQPEKSTTTQTTTIITTSTITTTKTTTTTTGPTFTTREYTVPYTQSYLLGDIDMDGDITLIDYFIAARNWSLYYETEELRELSEDAFDRGNVDRVIGDTDQKSPISLADVDAIFEIAVSRKWFGMPDLTYEAYRQIYDSAKCEEYAEMMSSFYVFNDDGGTDRTELIGDKIPKEVRDFYNDAHIIEQTYSWMEGIYDFRFCNWSQAEFNEKMDELREILARN